MIYYIQKEAMYKHGVMWIGYDLEEAKRKADYFASNHDDGHHDYDVIEYKEAAHSDPDDTKDWIENGITVYTGVDSRANKLDPEVSYDVDNAALIIQNMRDQSC